MSSWYGPDLCPGQPSRRELHVLSLQLRYGQKVTAAKMGLSVRTVKNHMWSLYNKLEVDGASQAAIALGWLTIPAEYPDNDTPEVKRVKAVMANEDLAERIARSTYNYALGEIEQMRQAYTVSTDED